MQPKKLKPGPQPRPLMVRIKERLKQSGECWNWTGCVNSDGYGDIYVSPGKKKKVHRAMWELVNGEIPDGMCVCHHCDNPRCANPQHLFLGTHTENMRDMWKKKRNAPYDKFVKTGAKGESNAWSKLTEDEVRVIRSKVGLATTKELAEFYNVSTASICNIISRRTWSHI